MSLEAQGVGATPPFAFTDERVTTGSPILSTSGVEVNTIYRSERAWVPNVQWGSKDCGMPADRIPDRIGWMLRPFFLEKRFSVHKYATKVKIRMPSGQMQLLRPI